MNISNLIRPIETIYNGYRFRSRLEARWAVFFDALGIQYEYEPEGFKLSDGTMYLPDFRIRVRWRGEYCNCSGIETDECVYVEIKGKMTKSDMHKIEMFPYPIIILGNIPLDDKEWSRYFDESKCKYYSYYYMDFDVYPAFFSIYKDEPWITGADHEEWDLGKSMNKALLKARQARFEHGEKPII